MNAQRAAALGLAALGLFFPAHTPGPLPRSLAGRTWVLLGGPTLVPGVPRGASVSLTGPFPLSR